MMRRVILASASPRRRELLGALIDAFETIPTGIDETFGHEAVADAMRLAEAKARAVAEHHPDALVVGADTIVHDGERAYAKPADQADAIAMLTALRGRTHDVVTGISVISDGVERTAYSLSRVTMTDLSDEQVRGYVASGRPMDKAGAYAIQDEDVPTVSWVEGCYCCVVGLPLYRLRELLEAAEVECHRPDSSFARCSECPEKPS